MTNRALVTGGTRGIGAAIAKKLKNNGFNVIANYHANDEAAQEFSHNTQIPTEKWDVANLQQCHEAIQNIKNKYGHIDILINNAGIVRDAMFHKMDSNRWEKVINVNLMSVFNMTRPLINDMREKNYGRIINIASINAQKGQIGQVNYSAAKAGVVGFSKALAQENARKNITVNCICPGYIETDMTQGMSEQNKQNVISQIPMGRLGKPEEIASMTAWLVSDEAAYITGAVFSINGGQYIANG